MGKGNYYPKIKFFLFLIKTLFTNHSSDSFHSRSEQTCYFMLRLP